MRLAPPQIFILKKPLADRRPRSDDPGAILFRWPLPTLTGLLFVFTEFFIGFLLGFTGFYWFLLGFIDFYWVILGFTGYYRVLLGFTGFYLVLLAFTGFYWVLLGFTGITGFYLV